MKFQHSKLFTWQSGLWSGLCRAGHCIWLLLKGGSAKDRPKKWEVKALDYGRLMPYQEPHETTERPLKVQRPQTVDPSDHSTVHGRQSSPQNGSLSCWGRKYCPMQETQVHPYASHPRSGFSEFPSNLETSVSRQVSMRAGSYCIWSAGHCQATYLQTADGCTGWLLWLLCFFCQLSFLYSLHIREKIGKSKNWFHFQECL